MLAEYHRNGFTIVTDPARQDVAGIHRYLSEDSYWAAGIPLDLVKKAVANSLNFGIYQAGDLAGYARVITDQVTFAYLCDVFVLEKFRGQGLARWLMQCIQDHPDLQGLRRFMLMTRDAHPLYRQFGFTALKSPENGMEITRPAIYQRAMDPAGVTP